MVVKYNTRTTTSVIDLEPVYTAQITIDDSGDIDSSGQKKYMSISEAKELANEILKAVKKVEKAVKKYKEKGIRVVE